MLGTVMTSDESRPLLQSNDSINSVARPAYDAIEPSKPPSDNRDHADPTTIPSKRKIAIFAAIWTSVFLGALDTTIVATLVSGISSDFSASNQASWLATSYLLTTATFTPLYGRLSDIIGRRWAHLTALMLFTTGTLMCGLSGSMGQLIAARLIAGIGGGGIMTTSSIIASDLIPLKKRGLIQGLANICFGAGAGLGGPVGGLIADTVGWRWAFLIQVPILLLAIILVTAFVRYRLPGQATSKKEMASRIDYGGCATLIVCIGSLLLSLSFKNNEGYPWGAKEVWVPLIVFGVFLGGFILVETKYAKEPALPMRIMLGRSPFFIAWMNFIVSMNSFSLLYMLPLYFTTVKLTSSSEAGLHLIPNSFALSFGSLFAGWYMRRTGDYWWLIVISAVLPVVAFGILAGWGEHGGGKFGSWIDIMPLGFGVSSLITALLIALISAVDRADMAVATGISYLFRYTGQVVGVAISSAVLQAVLTGQLQKRITGPGAAELIDEIRHTATMVRTLPPDIQREAIASYSAGLKAVFILNAALAGIGLLCALPIREYPLPGSFQEEEEERQRRNGEPSDP